MKDYYNEVREKLKGKYGRLTKKEMFNYLANEIDERLKRIEELEELKAESDN